jgi:DNA-binding response OmpR family regulator
MRILVVEDDLKLAESLRRGLVDQHYSVDVVNDGREGEYSAKINDYDVIVLDVMLPRKDGTTVCRDLRSAGVKTPILMLTAVDGVENKILGLDAGADDYLTKPFHFGELLARIRTLIRRKSDVPAADLEVSDLVLNMASRTVTRAGTPLKLTAKEFALLEYMALNRGRVLTREMIAEHVWDMNFDPRSNVIDSFVRFLRQKVDKGFSPQLIHTVRGVGYRFSEEE